MSIIKHDTQTRIFVKKNHVFLNTIASYLRRKFYRNGGTTYSNFLNMEAHLFQTQDKKQNRTLVFSSFFSWHKGDHKIISWTCGKCEKLPKLQPVCSARNCSPGYFPLYLSRGCCWNCHPCYAGYVKPSTGQRSCFKCQLGTITNTNKTKCLPFIYRYFQISKFQQVVAAIFSAMGGVYTTVFLGVFLYYKETPIVKSSNIKLSVIQIMLHFVLNIHLAITSLEQTQYMCLAHSIIGGYLLKSIMSVYIIKTNQLLTVFQSTIKVQRSVSLTLKESIFPVAFLTTNILITIIFFTIYSEFKFGLLEIKDSPVISKYCNLSTYFYLDITLVTIQSVSCSIKAFIARKLPTNYNETYYIFLVMFTTTILLLVAIPLRESFNQDGEIIFVDSCIIYSANMALISIAYGYKTWIILFQKQYNTIEAFQKVLFKMMQENVNKQTQKSTKI